MPKSFMVSGNVETSGFTLMATGDVGYLVCANAPLNVEYVRANTQITYRTAGVMSLGRVNVDDNLFANTAYLVLEINGVAGNTSITIPAGTIGVFTDSVHTDVINVGDKVNWKLITVNEELGTSIYFRSTSIVFKTYTDTVVRHAATNFAKATDALTGYAALSDNCVALNPTEVYARFDFNAACTIKNLFVHVSQWTNTSNFSLTVTVRKNGANDGSPSLLSVNKTGAATAPFILEDITNSVSVAVNDDVNYSIVTSGTGSCTIEIISIEEVSTTKQFHSIFAQTGSLWILFGAGQQRFLIIGGGSSSSSLPENSCHILVDFPIIVSNFTAYIIGDTIDSLPGASSGSHFYIRKNNVNGNCTFGVPELSAPAQFEDSTYNDSFIANDNIDIYVDVSGLRGVIVISHIGMLIQNTDTEEELIFKQSEEMDNSYGVSSYG